MSDRAPRSRELVAVLLAGLVLWTVGIYHRSLWNDEFHSYEHACAATFPAFVKSLAADNHPPLSFLLMRWSRALFGESHLALRWWSMAEGLGTIALTARVARRLPSETGRRAAPWLVVLSSFSFMIFTEARMYGLLALAALGLLESVASALEGKSRGLLAALWIAVGLHSHYYFLHYGFVLAIAVLVLATVHPSARRGALRLVLPAAVGCLSFLPWALTGFARQLQHDLGSGGSAGLYLNAMGYCQSIAHLLFIHASGLGRWASLGVALPGAAAGALVGALGLARLARTRREGGPVFLPLLLTVAFAVPAWSFIVAWIYTRAGYNWRYIAGSLVPVLLIVAEGIRFRPWPRAALSGVLIAALATITLFTAFSPGQEDFRGAVRYILQHAQPGDAVLIRHLQDRDPETAPTGWEFYKDRVERPAGGVEPVAYRLSRYELALAHERVWLFKRYHYAEEIFARLEAEFARHDVIPIGPVLTVHLFSR